ncbi:cytosolic protein [Paenibacillus sambharensis]|uniref:Cytosolic protein n=1 Tax=Paenibacillus sambharensis TaxID=1803190 RepID=A0A2W1LAI5_9BACL|nr:cytosolic protein [Paenibacillus sambharensis]
MPDYDFMSDTTEDTSTRFVTFITPGMKRFDLSITTTSRFYGKKLVTDLQNGITAILGADDLEEEGYLAHVFKLSDEEAAELEQFLYFVVGTVNFTD